MPETVNRLRRRFVRSRKSRLFLAAVHHGSQTNLPIIPLYALGSIAVYGA